MGQTTNKIETYIESKRDELGANLAELEDKVKSATDWRQQFQKNPMTILGVAVGSGVLLATLLGGRRSRRRYSNYSMPAEPVPHAGTDHQKHKAMETWDNIKGALIGVAATQFKDFVGELVPGFHEQFKRTEAKATGMEPS